MNAAFSQTTTKNYTPYRIVEEQPHRLQLKLKKGYAFSWFTGFRIAPVFMFSFLGIASFGLYQDMPRGIFIGMYLFFIIGILYLWFQRYVRGMILEKGKITQKISTFFSYKDETEILNEDDSILVTEEHRGRSSYWSFYLISHNKSKRLFHIPIFFNQHIQARNSFVQAFEEICGIQVVVQDKK